MAYLFILPDDQKKVEGPARRRLEVHCSSLEVMVGQTGTEVGSDASCPRGVKCTLQPLSLSY